MSEVIAFIPARSGSKRLKNKNIKIINSHPLIFWTIYKAIKSKIFDKIIFSSDSIQYYNTIISLLRKKKISTKNIFFDLRSKKDTSDKKKIFDYLKKSFVKKIRLNKTDLIVLLLPTAPLRKIGTIRNVVKISLLQKKDFFTANNFEMSIKNALIEKKNNNWSPAIKNSPLLSGNTRSQDQKQYLRPNPVCCCLWVKNLKKKNSIYNNSKMYKTNKIESIDIDTQEDFLLANLISKYFRNNIK